MKTLTVVSGLRASHVTTSEEEDGETAVVGFETASTKSRSLQQTSKTTGHEASSGLELTILAFSGLELTILLLAKPLGSMTPSPSVTM